MSAHHFFSASSSEGSEDEEATRREREQLLRRRQAEQAAVYQRRRQAEADEEERRFGAAAARRARIAEPTFGERLERHAIHMHPDERRRAFLDGIARVVDAFRVDDDEFAATMRAIRTEAQLIRLIEHMHTTQLAAEPTPETESVHEWLVEYYKEAMAALREMTAIPAETPLHSLTIGNPFQIARESVERRLAVKKDHEQLIQAQRRKEEAEFAELLDSTTNLMRTLTSDFGDRERCTVEGQRQLSRELSAIAVQTRLDRERRETSPRRAPLSRLAEQQLAAMFHNLTVHTSARNAMIGEEEEEKRAEVAAEVEEDPLSWMFGPAEEEEEQEQEQKPTMDAHGAAPADAPDSDSEEELKFDTRTAPSTSTSTSTNRVLAKKTRREPTIYEPTEDELRRAQHIRNVLRDTRRALPACHYFGNPTQSDEHRVAMDTDRYWRRERRVRFADFDDARNTMRIFTQEGIYYKGDNGTESSMVQLQLKKGWAALWNAGDDDDVTQQPFVVKTERTLGFAGGTAERLQRITKRGERWMWGAKGNPLGRFWFDRAQLATGRRHAAAARLNAGLVTQYTEEELANCYTHKVLQIEREMGRDTARQIENLYNKHDRDDDKLLTRKVIRGVLILTDWRLIHLNEDVITNAVIQYLPTNLGDVFFQSMVLYLSMLLRTPSIEIRTIIFAFGGSPTWQKEHFGAFLTKLLVLTLKTVDVFWLAQDWTDGLTPNEEADARLSAWNSFVKRTFKALRKTGNDNYKWANVRQLYNIRRHPPRKAESTVSLECIYSKYVEHMIQHCNCYGRSNFFPRVIRRFDDHPEDEGIRPHQGSKFLKRTDVHISDDDVV